MEKPRYVQIYEQFKKMILEGQYEEHQKLPSKRKLADHLKTSPLTIDAAYQQLIAEGFVYAIEKKGFFVAKKSDLVLGKTTITHPHFTKIEKKRYAYSFETNVVDTTLFPNATWAKLSREVISENHHEMLNNVPSQGLDVLRAEIAKYLAVYRGIHVPIERIIIGSGSTSLISMIIELLGRHVLYALEKPGFTRIEQLFQANDVQLVHVPIDDHGLSVLELKKTAPHVVHLTPSHQYPTGIVMPISRRIELLNWAVENQAYLIEDDYDSEFRFQGKPIPALQGLDQNNRVIYMNTFSKSLAPSFRMSYMVLPEHLMNRYLKMSVYHGCTVPTFDQYVLYKFMNGGYFERHINRMRHQYREKLEWIRNFIHPFSWIKLHGDEAGLHFIMEIMVDIKKDYLVSALEKNAIQVSLLYEESLFQYPCLVIGYSGILMSGIKQAFETLISTLQLTIKESN